MKNFSLETTIFSGKWGSSNPINSKLRTEMLILMIDMKPETSDNNWKASLILKEAMIRSSQQLLREKWLLKEEAVVQLWASRKQRGSLWIHLITFLRIFFRTRILVKPITCLIWVSRNKNKECWMKMKRKNSKAWFRKCIRSWKKLRLSDKVFCQRVENQ